MKDRTYLLNTILAAVVCAALLAAVLLRTFIPAIVLPELNIPNLVLLSLVALLIEHYIGRPEKRCYICIPVFSLITFALLPWASGMFAALEAVKIGAVGCVVFTATTWVFSSMQDRLSSGPAAKAAPIVGSLCMYCAVQCFTGILL
ncbi:MAG: hypothetical protein IJ466_12270 [Clostridia bacterium]|nr:hypothetical protein [Clostridia bacterium]